MDALDDFDRTSGSATNQMRTLKSQFEDAAGVIGEQLLPVATRLMEWVSGLITRFSELNPGLQQAILAFAGLMAAIGPIVFVIGALISPIGLIVAGIAALVAAAIYAYTHFDGFRQLVDEVARSLVVNFQAALVTLQQFWHTFGDEILTYLGGVFQQIRGVFNIFAGLFTGDWGRVWEGIKGIVRGGLTALGALIGAIPDMFRPLGGAIAAAASGMFDGIKAAFKSAINWIINAWNQLEFKIPGFDPPGPGPTFNGFTLGTPSIPLLAQGGNITRGGAAIVGDAGPELLNLPTGASVTPLGRAGGVTVNVSVGGSLIHERDLATYIEDILIAHQRRNGR